MKYIAFDIETTGLDPKKHQVLEMAAVLETEDKNIPVKELPLWHVTFKFDTVCIDPELVEMHKDLLTGVRKGTTKHYRNLPAMFAEDSFREWLGVDKYQIHTKNFAGKNLQGFDFRFVPWVQRYAHRRVLDPAILYAELGDVVLPNLVECKKRAGLSEHVSHSAVDDARDIVRLLRAKGL